MRVVELYMYMVDNDLRPVDVVICHTNPTVECCSSYSPLKQAQPLVLTVTN